ncbi:MAG: tetratricopeptide repeat protein, partial [Gammaproteobacteria bacterium]
LEPDNPKALFYGGMVATLRGDHDLTRARWQKLLGMSPPENIRHMLEQQLGQLGSPTAAAAPEPQAQKGDGAIAISLSVAPDLATRIDGNAILFVLARRPDVPGPPIAAIRASASPLPATLSISDANAMIAGRSLQGLDTVELVARVSRGGDPIAAPGDLYGEAIWNAAANSERRVEIVIDRIVE